MSAYWESHCVHSLARSRFPKRPTGTSWTKSGNLKVSDSNLKPLPFIFVSCLPLWEAQRNFVFHALQSFLSEEYGNTCGKSKVTSILVSWVFPHFWVRTEKYFKDKLYTETLQQVFKSLNPLNHFSTSKFRTQKCKLFWRSS